MVWVDWVSVTCLVCQLTRISNEIFNSSVSVRFSAIGDRPPIPDEECHYVVGTRGKNSGRATPVENVYREKSRGKPTWSFK